MRRILFSMHTKWRSRPLAVALVLIGVDLAAADPPPVQEKTNTKESPASFRAYLPRMRLKALLDNERQAVADLERWLRAYDVWLEAGAVNLIQRSQIEEEYHRSRIRALRLDTDYRDSLDEFTSRIRMSKERRRQMEHAALAPMTMHLQRFEELARDLVAATLKPLQMDRAEDVAKIGPVMVKNLTESALVKNTTLPKRFLKLWDEWKKLEDRRKFMDRITKIRNELTQLRVRQIELVEKQKELPDADRQRMEALKFELDLGEFQLGLHIYEQQSWKNIKDDAERLKRMRETFFGLERAFGTLLDHAYMERFDHLVQSWPGLAPVRIKDVDLLAGKRDRAEETVPWELKSPDAQLASKKKVRHIRMLAESYPIQQRLFQLAFVWREDIKRPKISKPPPADDVLPEVKGLTGPIGPRPELTDPSLAPEPLLKAEASFVRAKRQLLQTWIDYQMARLDLYGDLGMSPPER